MSRKSSTTRSATWTKSSCSWANFSKFEPKHDDKLKALLKLLSTDRVLKKHKLLIFSEFADTARYLHRELADAGIAGVEQIDSGSKKDRGDVIRRFAPYYNGTPAPNLPRMARRKSASSSPPMCCPKV